MQSLIERLLASDEPAVRLKVMLNVVKQVPDSEEIQKTREAVAQSPRVNTLLSERGVDGRIPYHPYAKWIGAHWVLATLAEIGYPTGDRSLLPLVDQVIEWLFSLDHEMKIQTIQGRVRRCASQEGNALFAIMALGLEDAVPGRTEELASRLMRWQWPDGGWNCDKRPEASHSSFMETLIPLRALSLYSRLTGDGNAAQKAALAGEIFLKRSLFRRLSDSSIIKNDFTLLHYPCYWHYDLLFGLRVLAEAGFLPDVRCADALRILEARQLPDGGWPMDKAYYRLGEKAQSGRSLVSWGTVSRKKMNEFISADVLSVFKASGKI